MPQPSQELADMDTKGLKGADSTLITEINKYSQGIIYSNNVYKLEVLAMYGIFESQPT